MPAIRHPQRLPFLVLAAASLVAGLLTGLARLGFALPAALPRFEHGPLMIGGFLGTLIGLERAVACGRRWAYAGPALTGAGALALLAGPSAPLAPPLITAGSAVVAAVLACVVLAERALHTATITAGAIAWTAGNAAWVGGAAIPELVAWWAAFLVLTIAGERLELGRVIRVPDAARRVFIALVVALLAGCALGGVATPRGAVVFGATLLAFALWLARHDVARRTIRLGGLPAFTATCVLSGYVWLAAAGALAVASGPIVAGPVYDAVLHALFLGFVFAMIFGHAPIIFPAVVGVAIPFHRAFYAHLAVLHASLVVRVAGDLAGSIAAPRAGALLNAAAIALFLASTVRAVLTADRGAAVAGALPMRRGAE